jgi:oxygen-independent coproporphyrinogen III oxidase
VTYVDEFPLSLYLHIPFCQIKCSYCAFNTYTHLDHLIPAFVSALIREIEIVGTSKPGQHVHTIFIGGGTPSVLSPNYIDRILRTISANFEVDSDVEITIETNPRDLNSDYLQAVREIGVNRISIGMQSANAWELELFARRHSLEDVVQSVGVARVSDFTNLNLDLIYGTPNQTLTDWENTLDTTLRLQPDHISLYALGLEPGTSLENWVSTGKLPQPDDDLAADMYDLATNLLGAAGYIQYEISNWSKPGLACRHNLQYWRNLTYPGFGPGAHGFAGGIRYSVLLSPQRYIKALSEDSSDWVFPRSPAVENIDVVDRETEIAETLIMGLRLTQEGIKRAAFATRFNVDLLDYHGPVLERYKKLGLLEINSERVILTREGRLLSNTIFRDLV